MARPTKHGETKAKKSIYVTPESWDNLEEIAKNDFFISRSELIELLGQGKLIITRPDKSAAA
ncbi:hypothetical protein [Calothrix sp. FACHB-168]|uniref:hypothetical protein n=1 Tax=Calothrix sp. FACHB-168 TaxID=2692780 RepID=UPI001689CC42|nr:hypothetical protein [Calothrix sp. FACHB-168]MBD2208117.1 hypothetical protein [Calothrix sp. FACHB-168]